MQNEPALEIDESGNKFWYLNGELHRTDGPAIEYANGDKRWFLNGVRHRTDGPAVEYANGNIGWFRDDKLHREDGPAVEYANGDKRWCLDGTEYTFGKWLELTPLPKQEKLKLRLKYAE